MVSHPLFPHQTPNRLLSQKKILAAAEAAWALAADLWACACVLHPSPGRTPVSELQPPWRQTLVARIRAGIAADLALHRLFGDLVLESS